MNELFVGNLLFSRLPSFPVVPHPSLHFAELGKATCKPNRWFGEDVQIETPVVSKPAVLVHGGDETSETDAGNEPKGFTFFVCWETGRWGFHGAGCFQRNWPGIRESPLFLSSFALLHYMCLYKFSEFFICSRYSVCVCVCV